VAENIMPSPQTGSPSPRGRGSDEDITCVAVDWSGARVGAHKRIWLAEAREGELIRLENGRSAADLIIELIETASRVPSLAVGLDFAFSFPAWFLDEHLASSAHDLWRLVLADGESWLAACEPPFWGRPGRPRPAYAFERGYRRGELALDRQPKSVFQIGGSGSVGTGSIRGMPLLLQLHEAGFNVWPFDPPGFPLALEIYPRLLTGPVIKSNAQLRLNYIAERYPGLKSGWVSSVAKSEDAFDAAISALVMSEYASSFSALPECHDSVVRKEGCIWHPAISLGESALTQTPSAS
jgi:hypothetical protein